MFAREAQDDAIVCAVNVSAKALQVPIGEILLASEPGPVDPLPPGAAAWVRLHG